VDRTADLQHAARELISARFSFGGRSPYAPDIVLVNEFVKQAFLEAVVNESLRLTGSDAPYMNGSTRLEKSPSSSTSITEAVDSLKKADSELRIVSQDMKHAIVELVSRNTDVLTAKMNSPVFVIHCIRSLDDGIDLLRSTAGGLDLAAFHFGNPKAGKYMAQFVDANISFVGHIPRQLIVGPAYPALHPISLTERYPAELFSCHRPAFINPSPSSTILTEALSASNAAVAQELLKDATSPLTVAKRKHIRLIGFVSGYIEANQCQAFTDIQFSLSKASCLTQA
jgi:hypothetical protein